MIDQTFEPPVGAPEGQNAMKINSQNMYNNKQIILIWSFLVASGNKIDYHPSLPCKTYF